ncbi:MAG: tRNA 2-thiouridine(34) synthase MnmA [Oscillospiraceae bacterium]|jgi:tRNA-specific 2-thiouridylase|nr:tRNA 2-thiouridine(34) synthase MnmA [Oscillospiraceae bacterium]
MRKVLVAMSGGVDSAAAALILLEQGYEVAGATLALADTPGSSSAIRDAADIAKTLGFAHHAIDSRDIFRREVMGRFARAYEDALTPNPCVDCNRLVKFPALHAFADGLGLDGVATGHYARVERDAGTGRFLLRKARDAAKDQTYVLYALPQEILSRTLFPLGGLTKGEVRALAESAGLKVAAKPDSQDICFVPDGDYAGFLTSQMGVKPVPGPVIDRNGAALGSHAGIIHYTVGQRKGLPVSFGEKTYVIAKDAETAALTVGRDEHLYAQSLTARDCRWVALEQPRSAMRVSAKTRYSQTETDAVLEPLDGGRVHVRFEKKVRAVTPGQSAVFYDGEYVVGGGIIE